MQGQLAFIKELNNGYAHAEHLTLFIQEGMNMLNLTFNQLDAIAVSQGPGSYTGLRIGTSTAKGICYATSKPLIAIDTLAVIAFAFKRSNPITGSAYICPMLDARRMEVYAGLFDSALNTIKVAAPLVLDENVYQSELDRGLIYFCGDGAQKLKPLITQQPNAKFTEVVTYPDAAALAELAQTAYAKQQFENLAYFEPHYLKGFVPTQKKLV